MDDLTRRKYLPIALRTVGAVFILGVYPLTVLWPSGWAWHGTGHSDYLQMIIALYATLGVFLVLTASRPEEHLGLIGFTVWSSVVHGGVMAVQSLANPQHAGHLVGDVPALLIVAGLLAWLCPSAATLRFVVGR